MKEFFEYEMKEYSNMKIGGLAKKLIILEKKEEISEINLENEDIFLIGNGTNILLNDKYLDKIFVCMKNINTITDLGKGRVYVESGSSMQELLDFMEEKNYSGIENLAGIPGSIGGLIYMNGGAFGSEIFDNIESIEIVDENKKIRKIKKNELNFTYRKTEIQEKKWLVLSAIFQFKEGYDKNKVNEIINLRESKHPLDKPSLGSTFKNPEGDFAARLISECGLKGKIIGDAQISEKHPNFILNLGNAKFDDIINILNLVKEEVFKKFAVKLEEEIIIVR